MPHSGGGGSSGGGFGGGSHSSGSGSSTPHYTRTFHPSRGYFIHGHYYDVGVRPNKANLFFGAVWSLISCVPLALGIVSAARHEPNYDEDGFYDYSLRQYNEIYASDASDYEDHIVTVFALKATTTEEYCFYSIVGDNVKYNVDCLFGNNDTTLGTNVTRYVPKDYGVNFDEALALIIPKMQEAVTALGNENNLKTKTASSELKGILRNDATCFRSFTSATVQDALDAFQAATGVGWSIAIEDFDKVFSYNFATEAAIPLGFGIVFLALGAWIIISSVRANKEIKEATQGGTSSRYYYDETTGTNLPNPDGEDGKPHIF